MVQEDMMQKKIDGVNNLNRRNVSSSASDRIDDGKYKTV